MNSKKGGYNMKFYNIHRSNQYDDLYYEGSSFIVGDKPNQLRNDFLSRSITYIDHTEKKNDITINYRKPLRDLINVEKISSMSDKEKIELVNMVYGNLHDIEIDLRELILEDVRLRYFNDRPSRNSCMWITDYKSLSYWKRNLKSKSEVSIFEVDVDGNLFVSTDTLLPYGYLSSEHIYEQSFKYWNPKEEDLKNAKDKEYLFEGRVKILRRVK